MIAIVLTLHLVLPAQGGRPMTAERESLRAVELRLRQAMRGSPAFDSLRARRDTLMSALVAAERARTDSLVAARRHLADSLSRANPPRRDPLRGDGPFFGYTWVLYADLVVGGALSWLVASRFGRRHGGLRTAAAVLWAIIGAIVGAFVFGVVFIANGFWSVGFTAMSPPFFFLVTLMGMVAALGAVADISQRRRRR